jgi:uncharacterized protein
MGESPLYRAALTGDLEAVRRLLEDGADVNAANDDNRWTVLMAALDHPDVVAELLEQPSLDVNARAENGVTALYLAAARGDEHLVDKLAAHPGVDLDAKDDVGRTALTRAVFAGHRGAVERLLARPQLRVNLVDRDRQTALHWAALAGNSEIVDLLLADPRTNAGIRNRPDGLTARDVAAGAGHDSIAAAIDAHCADHPCEDGLEPGDAPPEVSTELPLPRHPLVPELPGLREPKPPR